MPNGYNNLGASTTIQSDSVKIFDSMSFSADGEPVYLTLNENYLINQLNNLTTDFNITSLWKKIVVSYSPENSEQIKILSFRRRPSDFKCTTSWTTYAYTGTWKVYKIYIVNQDGALIEYNGSNFPNDDITIS